MSLTNRFPSILTAALLAMGLFLLPGLTQGAQACMMPLPLAITGVSPPLLDNLGNHHYAISTQSEKAQQYFDQGLRLAYGFNHAEAARSFQAAIRADPNCAMCYLGLAYVLGPNINAPMDPADVPTAWEAVQEALALSPQASAKEQALIKAMAARYAADPGAERGPLDRAYTAAMRQVHEQYPADVEIATLYAEALMDTMPWDYWDEADQPKPATVELLDTLDGVLAEAPNHIGALHLYIHVVEKAHPELAENEADRLLPLVPGSGHLVHMPSHIYIRVGRYHDAVTANQAAIEADNAYPNSGVPTIYTLAYEPHNHHFKWFGALMTGQRAIALIAARQAAAIDPQILRNPLWTGALQHLYVLPLFTQVRFGLWPDVLATSAPAPDLKYAAGVWHYAQGRALAATGDPGKATAHLRDLQTLAADPDLENLPIWGLNTTAQVLELGAAVLAGDIAKAQGNYDQAITHLKKAADLEDHLVYTEPPDWYSPTHNLLGQALLAAGHAAEAEAAFQADLTVYPENGWSLYGLVQSLQAQDRPREAEAVRSRFEQAWQYADAGVVPVGG